MGLFDFLFSKTVVVTCDQCGVEITGEPVVHRGQDLCVACEANRRHAIEMQREAEEAARERLASRQRFQNR
ncbi:MAG: hypothetical protein AAGA48_24160 [Myxococcota bacterium]